VDPEMPSHDAEGLHLELTSMNGSSTKDNDEWRQKMGEDNATKRPSNEKLLSTAFLSFMSFTLVQTVAAVIAGSEAMMGDSAAMFVDALTYLFNLVAERKKNQFDQTWQPCGGDHQHAKRIRQRAKRKMVLTMELVPPLISVTTLIGITIVVTQKAVRVLVLDTHRDVSLQGDPNINLMLFFSSLNLGLDFLNVFCFAKAKHLMGFETGDGHPVSPTGIGESYESVDASDFEMIHHDDSTTTTTIANENGLGVGRVEAHAGETIRQNGEDPCRSPDPPGRKGLAPVIALTDSFASSSDDDDDERSEANLNMCSAYTHVFADTLRSIAVIIAVMFAKFVGGVTPEEADATAAIVVSGLILLSLLPLFHGLVRTYSELRAIRAEESSEKMFPEHANTTNTMA
jgi:Co/Zn/Cd efflux system component